MKIAITSERPDIESLVDPRFGRAKVFMVFDDKNATWEVIDNKQNLQAAQGAGIQSAANVVNAGCTVLISGHCGPKAFTALNKAEIAVYTVTEGTVKNALDSYKQGKLTKIDSANVEGHW
jgi:predicted Fe-Mo cluster-binding NifX family protein